MKSYLQESDKESHQCKYFYRNFKWGILYILKARSQFLLDQNTLSTLDYETISDPFEKLENTGLKNEKGLRTEQLNINSLRNRFGSLVRMLHNNLEILLISGTKIYSSYSAISNRRL